MSVKGSRCEAAFFCLYRTTDNRQQTTDNRLWVCGVLDLQAFRTTCSIPAYNLSLLRDFFELKIGYEL